MPMHKGHVLVPLEDRFWAKVDKRGPDECWPWTSITSKGDGAVEMSNTEHWPTGEDMVPGPAYDRLRAALDGCKAHHEKAINKAREQRDEARQEFEGAVGALRALLDGQDYCWQDGDIPAARCGEHEDRPWPCPFIAARTFIAALASPRTDQTKEDPS